MSEKQGMREKKVFWVSSQVAHFTSYMNERNKDLGSLLCPKWRGYICPLGP